ncbi:hypothetical protein BJ508DRAFT_419671 [Ascobolus immersus RN42]|uniref:Thioesterase family protein n=1 Tax=Ascobolus immersus RN42 TaxID=1160509 RepID=A0A3N4HGW3_ASCIM|nr:hypothetical protein BJ508DRAFT_419671 [Ascobolus immersus RN42]
MSKPVLPFRKPGFKPSSFKAAVRPIADSESAPGVYNVDLPADWTIGIVPHGGYLTSLIMATAMEYMTTVQSKYDQPDPIAVHLEFPNRSAIGPAKITVKPVKLGRSISLLYVCLSQAKDNIIGFISMSNIEKENGENLRATGYGTYGGKVPDRVKDCQEFDMGGAIDEFRAAPGKLIYSYPEGGPMGGVAPGMRQHWVRWGRRADTGERFDLSSLGFVSDMFVPLAETHPDYENQGLGWYPTVNLNLEIKKRPPPGGWEWLFVEVRSELIKNGRLDLRVVIREEGGDIVAIGGQVALILSMQRNIGKPAKL